jgi:hypothetical protein
MANRLRALLGTLWLALQQPMARKAGHLLG